MVPRNNPPPPPDPDDETTRVLGDSNGKNNDRLTPELGAIRLPGFEIIRELGRGGMGQVLLARQTEPVEREVAIKLILQKIRNPATELRFQVERQALAEMRHPAIAQIFEAGTNPDGFPYFVMEYVPGAPIDLFCAEHRLTLRQRLALFVQVCNGVQHAHQKGMIHRDLKPANILVSWVDGIPSPKIIDFGIATAAHPTQDRKSESSAGTPLYMSPELFGDHVGIDTRSDIYSLGVILYELLCDQRPWPRELFRGGDIEKIRIHLAENQPPLPSELAESAGEHAGAIADRRQTRPSDLRRALQGDLDAIAGKAVSASRDDRYNSGTELADDIKHYLASKPVRAMGDARGYRLKKFVQRNAWPLAGVAGIVVALAIGLALAIIAMHEARQQQQIAETRQSELERMVAFQQSMLGDLDPRAFGEGVVDGLRRQYFQSLEREADGAPESVDMALFETAVGRASPTDLARELIDQFMLQRAIDSIETDFAEQPLLQADLLQTVLEVYRNTGMTQTSLDLAKRVVELRSEQLGPGTTEVLRARQEYAWSLFESGRFASARQALDEVLARANSTIPEQLEIIFSARNQLAIVLVEAGELEEALGLAEHLLERSKRELGPTHPTTAQALNTLGYVHARSGRREQALEYYQASLESARQFAQPSDPAVYGAMLNVAAALGGQDRLEEALALEAEVLAILSQELGQRNSATLRVMNNKALTLMDLDRLDEARPLLERVVALRTETLGPQHPLTLRSQLNFGRLLMRTGSADSALEQFLDVVQWRQRLLSDGHLDTQTARFSAAEAALATAQLDLALDLARKAYDGRLAALDADHLLVLSSQRQIADIHQARNDSAMEIEWRQRFLDSLDRTGSEDSPESIEDRIRQYEALIAEGELGRADSLALGLRQRFDGRESEFREQFQRFEQAVRQRLTIQQASSSD